MSKYIAEQVEAEIANYAEEAFPREEIDLERVTEMLHNYAALLRERESAKAGVTDEMVFKACDQIWVGRERESNMPRMRRALEAVAPMLASTRVPELENALRMCVSANAMLSEIEDGKTLYEGSPTHSTLCLLAWSNLNTAIANAKQVLAAAPKPETEE